MTDPGAQMPSEVPIASTLRGAEPPERIAEVAALGADTLVSARQAGSIAVSASGPASRSGNRLLVGGAMLMVVCCAVLPAVIGAAAGSAIGGWLGVMCAVLLAAGAGLVIHRRRATDGC